MPWQLATWPDDRKELVRDLWAQGWTAGEIGRRLKVTRNSVIGLCHRNKFPHGQRRTIPMSSPEPLPPAYFVREEPTPPVVRPALQLRPQPQPLAFLGLPLHELSDSQCRWPDGDGPFLFCGQPAVLASPYCPDHKARAHHK
jgi:hypothetical protein